MMHCTQSPFDPYHYSVDRDEDGDDDGDDNEGHDYSRSFFEPCFPDDGREYQRGIQLLDHPQFLLLHIPDNGTKMKLVKPANDPYHRNRIMERVKIEKTFVRKRLLLPYYALSHLWGVSKTHLHLWHAIGDLVDDEKGQPAAPVSMRPEKRETLLKLLAAYPDSYWWIDVLCARTDTPLAIMGDIYACCQQCIAMIDCDPDLIPQIHAISRDRLQNEKSIMFSGADHYLDYCSLKANILGKVMQCQWWKRVWTWQEIVLPKNVMVIAETAVDIFDSNTIDAQDLIGFGMGDVIHVSKFCHGAAQSMAKMTITCVEEISTCRQLNSHRVSLPSDSWIWPELFDTFGKSSRQCMDPVDYVFGMFGMCPLDIPRMADPNAVWQLFLAKLEDLLANDDSPRTRISDRARHFDLAAAQNMADVYQGLLEKLDPEE
ncbi:hypothetical protein O0I10_011748 [Lichtheimia ornata]|uniref:Heterokaryon incompatibility domain-containing protein n=1 Tax=Lichtheimia ornata TaxID=688661 RepID=A0AAD7USF5_9FUNG|nr:uncharacterized protein O0I10_011748 [Lichtheimia ornata]KAJ8652602.1 hypothetical protein O0I10_011748 [Lichtheimia ornata]